MTQQPPWGPQYDPRQHQQRLGQPQQPYPPQGQPWPQQGYQPPQPPPGWGQPPVSAPPKPPPAPPKQAPAPKDKNRLTGKGWGCLTLVILVPAALITWWLTSSGGGGSPGTTPATVSLAQASASASANASVQAAAAACAEKAPGPDVYVRTVDPGEGTEAEDTGGAWQWNYGKDVCMSAEQYALSQAVPFGGDCVTVAYASSNPGYDVDSDPAPPLSDVIAQAGPGC